MRTVPKCLILPLILDRLSPLGSLVGMKAAVIAVVAAVTTKEEGAALAK